MYTLLSQLYSQIYGNCVQYIVVPVSIFFLSLYSPHSVSAQITTFTMAQLSPSSKKVDEFLSSLSQISQDRLRENQKRQRDLQRDIDELRRTSPPIHHNEHGITELKFNRSARGNFYEKWKDTPPQLPSRPHDDESPPLPSRPKPEAYSSHSNSQHSKLGKPDKPEKPEKLERFRSEENAPNLPTRPQSINNVVAAVGIAMPVARKTESVTKALLNIPQYSARPKGTSGSGPLRSFGEMEKQIQAGSRIFSKTKPDVPAKPEIRSDRSKPELPKSQLLNSENYRLESSTSENFKSSKPLVPLKPVNKPLVPLKPVVKPTETPKEIQPKFAPLKPVKPAEKSDDANTKPTRPDKPSFKSFTDLDSQELKQQIQRLSPTKSNASAERGFGAPKPSPSSLKPVKPSKPEKLEVPEALNALSKLRPARPMKHVISVPLEAEEGNQGKTQLKKAEKEVEIQKPKPSIPGGFQTAKRIETPTSSQPKDSAALTYSQPDFRSKLSSILRSNTDPSANAPVSRLEPIRRSQSTKVSTKLTHPNKTRAKGPKRKLPKQIGSTDSTDSTGSIPIANSDEGIKEKPRLPSRNISVGSETTLLTLDTTLNNLSAFASTKLMVDESPSTVSKKKTPPIKPKKPTLPPKPKRIISGDLFI